MSLKKGDKRVGKRWGGRRLSVKQKLFCRRVAFLSLSMGSYDAALVAYQEIFPTVCPRPHLRVNQILSAPKILKEIERLTSEEQKAKLAEAGITEELGLKKFLEALEQGREWAVKRHLALYGFSPPPPSSPSPALGLGIFEMLGLTGNREVKEIGPSDYETAKEDTKVPVRGTG